MERGFSRVQRVFAGWGACSGLGEAIIPACQRAGEQARKSGLALAKWQGFWFPDLRQSAAFALIRVPFRHYAHYVNIQT